MNFKVKNKIAPKFPIVRFGRNILEQCSQQHVSAAEDMRFFCKKS